MVKFQNQQPTRRLWYSKEVTSHLEPDQAATAGHPRKAPVSPSDIGKQDVNKKIRILIADDHPIVREGLVHALNHQRDMCVIAETSNGAEVCQLYDKLSPDLLLLDLRMPGKDGLEVINELMIRTPKPRIVVMTVCQATEDIRLALTAAAKGYLLKEAEPDELWDTIRKVFAGDVVLPLTVSGKLAASLAEPQLSAREMQVLRQLCAGDSNKEIAQKIYLSESTVKFYIRHLYKKLGAVGRSAAIAIAARRGLFRIC